MKQMYEQLRYAYPLAEYESVSKDLEIFKQKNGDLIVRNKEYAEKISELQSKLRNLTDSVNQQRELKEYKDDLEKEFNMVRHRLESLDPSYRWENQLFYKMVEKLRRTKVSVTQAF